MTKHNFSLNAPPTAQKQLCNLCKNVIEAEKFQDHLIEHEMDNGTVLCAVCKAIFTSITGLKDHIRDHNLSSMNLKEVCPKCNSRFLYPAELAHHLHEHDLSSSDTNVVKMESESNEVVKEIKAEDDDDDYIEIEKVSENAV